MAPSAAERIKPVTALTPFSKGERQNRKAPARRPCVLAWAATLALLLETLAHAQTYTVLTEFRGLGGMRPEAGPILADGALYGTASDGGDYGNGVVFKVNTDGTRYQVLKSFDGGDGAQPSGPLVLAGSTLYGTTAYGGGPNPGVVFKVDTNGTGFQVLKTFTANEGANPFAGLALDGATLYGTTYYGGSSNWGVVFKLNTDGTGYQVLKNFTGSDGVQPYSGLVVAGGTLYGTTYVGGSSGNGVVFKMNTDGSQYAVLKSFAGGGEAGPRGGLAWDGTALYGTTSGDFSDYGTVFKVNTDGSGYTVLKAFTGDNGKWPYASLTLAGRTLFGTTFQGGMFGIGVGMVFRVNTDGSGFAPIKDFDEDDGAGPAGGLALAGDTLYGTASGGGAGYGVLFSLAGVPLTPPVITSPPLTQTAETGTTPSFWVEATNLTSGFSYQWFFGETNALAGATTASLELTNVQPQQAGAYTVVVTNAAGAVTSPPALLSVIAPVDRRPLPAVRLTGAAGSVVHVEYAASLTAAAPWHPLSDLNLDGGPQFCFDPSQPLPLQRFFRAWQTNGPRPTLDATFATAITLTGAIGSAVRVDYINQIGPTNAWVTLDTVTLTNTPQLCFDVTAFRQPIRLYRLVATP